MLSLLEGVVIVRSAACLMALLTLASPWNAVGVQGQAEPVLVGAGDVASCQSTGDEATARLLDAIPGTVFTAGDNAYESGTDREFRECYEPSWGRHRARTRPAPGNHDYVTARAAGYFKYFGPSAGDPSRGYYAYLIGAWHVLVLNSICWAIGGCGPESPQGRWLRAELAAARTRCAVAIMHHPRFSSGPHGDHADLHAVWQALHAANVDVVLAGHDHLYERFAPQDPEGRLDAERGVRQFTVGTGGRSHYAIRRIAAHSEIRDGATFGVLKLGLLPAAYSWEFIPEAGKTFRDSGTAPCH